jgi:hypothetical protein
MHDAQARITFAMARHAVVDLTQVVNARYHRNAPDRLPLPELGRLRQGLAESGIKLRDGAEFDRRLTELRAKYEAYAVGIAANLSLTLPPWIHPEKRRDNWQAGPWDRVIQARGLAGLGGKTAAFGPMDDHF